MSNTVTITLPTGTRVTCSEETAQKLGLKAEPKRPAPKKSAQRKTDED